MERPNAGDERTRLGAVAIPGPPLGPLVLPRPQGRGHLLLQNRLHRALHQVPQEVRIVQQCLRSSRRPPTIHHSLRSSAIGVSTPRSWRTGAVPSSGRPFTELYGLNLGLRFVAVVRLRGGVLMDHQRFDDLTRALASGTSRRTMLKRIAGGAAGATLAMMGADTLAAKCRDIGKPCQSDAQCCSRFCSPDFKCACPAGTDVCNGECVTCTGGQVVNPTTCACQCPTGTTLCNGQCVDLQTDENNCGACGETCLNNGLCGGGGCFCPTPSFYCSNSDACCVSGQTCSTSSPSGCCAFSAQPCNDDTPCCSTTQTCSATTGLCCSPFGEFCSLNSQCCSGTCAFNPFDNTFRCR